MSSVAYLTKVGAVGKSFIRSFQMRGFMGFYRRHYSFVNRLALAAGSVSTLYLLSLDNKISRSAKKFLLHPLSKLFEDVLLSRSVKNSGKQLVEELFKNKSTLDSVVFALNRSIKDKRFEQGITSFSKTWVIKTLQTPTFLAETKKEIISMIKTEEIKAEAVDISNFIKNDQDVRAKLTSFFANIFTTYPVYDKMLNLFQVCGSQAVSSKELQNIAYNTGLKIFEDSELQRFLYLKSIDFFSIVSNNKLKFGYDQKSMSSEKDDLLSKINKL